MRDVLSLAQGQSLASNLALLQVRNDAGALVYELYVGSDRILRLWSAAGGLRSTSINASTGVVVPNNGSSIRVEVSALANSSVIVRVDGVDRITLTGLAGATSGNQRYPTRRQRPLRRLLEPGRESDHTFVGTSQTTWLGPPGGSPSPPVNTSPPAVSGTAQEGQQLSASTGTWSGSPTGFAYQWRRCDTGGGACANVAGATVSTYPPVSADVGSTLRVRVTASNAAGSSSADSAQTAVVTAVPPSPPVNTSPPVVSGTAQEGQQLTSSTGTWSGSPTGFSYQWRRCDSQGGACSDVSGATASTYTLVAADVGSTLRARVTASNGAGSSAADSTQTAVVTAAPSGVPPGFSSVFTDPGCGGCSVAAIANGLRATIAGAADTLDTAYGVQDFGGSGGVSGRVYVRDVLSLAQGQSLASNLALLQVRNDAGALVYELYAGSDRILRLWSAAGGLRSTSINASTGVVVPNNGSSIRVEVSALANSSVIVRVDGVDRITLTGLAGATSGNQRTLRAGSDHYDGSSSQAVTSDHTFVGTSQTTWLGAPGGSPSPPVNTSPPAVSGTAQEGQQLSASTGTWSGSPTGFAYQWRRCDTGGGACANVAGATVSTYTPVSADVGSTLRVRVTASNAAGSSSADSAQTAVVTAVPPSPPVNTSPPVVSGTAQEGQQLPSSTGTWSGSPTGFSYQWRRCDSEGGACSNVSGATASTYTLVAADVGSTLRARVTASNGAGSSAADSTQTAVVTAAPSGVPPGFSSVFTDPGCGGCSVAAIANGLRATIAGAADTLDTAYGVQDFGGSGGVSGRVYVRDVLSLAQGQTLASNLALLQVRNDAGALVYELYVGSDRILRLWSAAGGLRSTSINASTGVVVPNNGSSIRVEVSALANSSVIVRVDGVDRITLTGLAGATSGNQRTLRAGSDHYDGCSSQAVTSDHTFVGTSQTTWLGAPYANPRVGATGRTGELWKEKSTGPEDCRGSRASARSPR